MIDVPFLPFEEWWDYFSGPTSPEMIRKYLSVRPSLTGCRVELVDHVDRETRVGPGQKEIIWSEDSWSLGSVEYFSIGRSFMIDSSSNRAEISTSSGNERSWGIKYKLLAVLMRLSHTCGGGWKGVKTSIRCVEHTTRLRWEFDWGVPSRHLIHLFSVRYWRLLKSVQNSQTRYWRKPGGHLEDDELEGDSSTKCWVSSWNAYIQNSYLWCC